MSIQKYMPATYRVERNSVKVPFSGCWLWVGTLDKYGYGRLQYNRENSRKSFLAHRIAYEAFIGPIPEGKFVCHTCDVPSCVNPDHLWIGTNQQNTLDRVKKNRSAHGESVGTSRLSPDTIRAIISTNGVHKEVAKAFGVSRAHVSRVKAGKSWKHIPRDA